MANVTADQASGAGSMAGAMLRTGQLSLLARAANLYFRGERWFHGAFLDARKQDALDLVSGAYQVGHGRSWQCVQQSVGPGKGDGREGAWDLRQSWAGNRDLLETCVTLPETRGVKREHLGTAVAPGW